MIEFVKLENFKSLKDVSLNLKKLNLFMGLNSMGKSSVIQSLLMLRQSYIKDRSVQRLYTNWELVSLGSSKDIFYQNADSDGSIKYIIKSKTSYLEIDYKYKDGTDVLFGENIHVQNEACLPLFSTQFHYLAADHISPSKVYKSTNASSNIYNQLGNNGENAPYYLAKTGRQELTNSYLHHNKAKSNLIAHELDAWIGEISPGARIVAAELPDLDIVKMSIQFETRQKIEGSKFVNEYTESYSPVNVGFGIPYVMPLILTILISNPGDLVLVENPESHLHPRGQAELGKLLALAAQSGVQIICETHSDHVINGIRVAAKENVIEHNQVGLFYFEKNKETMLETEVTPINVDKNGELDQYPKGLLDEWGNLMAQLF